MHPSELCMQVSFNICAVSDTGELIYSRYLITRRYVRTGERANARAHAYALPRATQWHSRATAELVTIRARDAMAALHANDTPKHRPQLTRTGAVGDHSMNLQAGIYSGRFVLTSFRRCRKYLLPRIVFAVEMHAGCPLVPARAF